MSFINVLESGQLSSSHMQPASGVSSPNSRRANSPVCTMPASDTKASMRESLLALLTPTAPPMLWPM